MIAPNLPKVLMLLVKKTRKKHLFFFTGFPGNYLRLHHLQTQSKALSSHQGQEIRVFFNSARINDYTSCLTEVHGVKFSTWKRFKSEHLICDINTFSFLDCSKQTNDISFSIRTSDFQKSKEAFSPLECQRRSYTGD